MRGTKLTRILFKSPDCKILAPLLLVVIATTACDRPDSGNADGPVDLNNPLLKRDETQNPPKVATAQTDSRDEEIRVLPKSRLASACADDTIVMGYGKDGELRETGSNIDGYCEGYLLAAYDSMTRAGSICNDDLQPPSAYFLRSVFKEHSKADRALSQGDAKAVSDAFLDAFSCKRTK